MKKKKNIKKTSSPPPSSSSVSSSGGGSEAKKNSRRALFISSPPADCCITSSDLMEGDFIYLFTDCCFPPACWSLPSTSSTTTLHLPVVGDKAQLNICWTSQQLMEAWQPGNEGPVPCPRTQQQQTGMKWDLNRPPCSHWTTCSTS